MLSFTGEACQSVLQGVYELYEILPSVIPWEEEEEDKRVNRVIVIGMNIDKDCLTKSFEQLLL